MSGPPGTFADTGAASVNMAGRQRAARGKGKGKAAESRPAIPDVYQEMLAEALPMQSDILKRPPKRRRTGSRGALVTTTGSSPVEPLSLILEDDEDIYFEDILDGATNTDPENGELAISPKQQQTAYRGSDEESEVDESDFDFGAFDFENLPDGGGPSGDLELTLTKPETPRSQKATTRRRVVSKAERGTRLEIHRMHILCLLSYLDRRNNWCNDSEVQKSLKLLLDKKTLNDLKPNPDLSQFGRTEFLKRGLEQTAKIWRAKFKITARGMKRALWADDEKDLQNYHLPEDSDLTYDKSDFRASAKRLKGSRDLGAQLYCALLRSAGLDVRLVCSLQPLTFNAGGPPMPRGSAPAPKPPTPDISEEVEPVNIAESPFGSNAPEMPFAPRRRLGHPNAADYHMPEIRAPVRLPPRPKLEVIQESPFPIFWVEVLDEAHQKWLPVDPLVTETIAKPRSFEPPMADRENNMSYVIAFEDVGIARDVTIRYAKAYNAKTRKNRIEFTPSGVKWWRKTMRTYSRGWKTDLDQIEDNELDAIEGREPMPKNIADFKDHPIYALERHLRRNEIIVAEHESGKVAAGRDPRSPGGKKLESVYRRRDVKVVRSADAWYRLGRDVKMGEQPVKTLPVKRRPGDGDIDDVDERPGTNLYTEDQTELYESPPVVNGRIPKNSFGNIDIYVPSMVPKGGVYLPYDEASRAARLLGIDYADALIGFEFRGRHGTAVLKGVVVASGYREAVEAVIEVGLRIKKRVDGYVIEGEEEAETPTRQDDFDDDDSDEYVDEGGGGFFPE
ncbi:hypothetical protein G7Y89_g9193 [Cudoniella acicularis]|uniref:Rad4-domain-containing protein n=1 Tax=Cudoniella acicularis TaxID=354080 RepID=A0A8H4RHS4_9HELO|nr:hypothetical protein G7Y89_g9193 [Cudoniella acicularis]